MDLIRLLQEHLIPLQTPIVTDNDNRPAAVLVPLYRNDSVWHLLYTRRTAHLAAHAGQVSFPGGQPESGDADMLATALREASEETGIHHEDLQILGRLRSFPTGTRFFITPFVAVLPWPYPLTLNPHEVARSFGVPISWLSDPANLSEYTPENHPPPPIPLLRYEPYEGEVIWGATAWITQQLTLLLNKI